MGEVILCTLREGLLGLDGVGGMPVQTQWREAGNMEEGPPREKRLN